MQKNNTRKNALMTKEIGCEGTHTHEKDDGTMIYMPCATHNEYVNAEKQYKKKCTYDKRDWM